MAIPTTGLVAHYSFDNISESTIVDEAGSYDATIIGTVNSVAGAVGNAAENNSVDDYINVPNLGTWFAGKSAFGLSFWTEYVAAGNGTQMLFCVSFSSHTSPFYVVDIRIQPTSIYIAIGDIANSIDTTIDTSKRHHVIINYDSSSFEVFIDDVSVGSLATVAALPATTYNACFGRIPAVNANTNAAIFNVDEFRLYDHALVAADRTILYAQGVSGAAELAFSQLVYDQSDVILQLEQSVVGLEGAALLAFNQIISDTGLAVAKFNQIVSESSSVSLAFDQSVVNLSGQAALSFVQTVSDTGATQLAFAQNIYTPASIVDSWTNWDVQVLVNNVDISDDLIDGITIDANRSAARTAAFTVVVSGVVDLTAWDGRPVVINYLQNNGAVWRRFSGVIETARFELSTKSIECACTDDRQRIIDQYTPAQLIALTGGFWTKHVFNDDNSGVDLLDDLLKTVPKSVELNSNRQLMVNSLFNKLSADYTFDDDLILDGSIAPKIAERSQKVNVVHIEFDVRFNRLYQATRGFVWQYSRSFCEQYSAPVRLPNQQMIIDAFSGGAWSLDSISFTPIKPSGVYRCNGNSVIFNNNYPTGITGFNARGSFRWTQSITEKYRITVKCPESIEKYGELEETLRASASIDSTMENWTEMQQIDSAIVQAVGQLGYAPLSNDFVQNEAGFQVYDDVDSDEINQSINALVQQAATMMLDSHQQNSVLFQLPLSPYIETDQTIAVDDPEVTAKGIIRGYTENYDFKTAEPITDIEIAISHGNSGQDIITQTISAPTRAELQAAESTSGLFAADFIPDYTGGLLDSPPEDPDWKGIVLNNTATIATSQTIHYYNERVEIPFPEIDDQFVLNTDNEIEHTLSISIPDNILTTTV